MTWTSAASFVLNAGRSLVSAIVRRPLIAALIVVLLLFVLYGREAVLSRGRTIIGSLQKVSEVVEENKKLKKKVAEMDAAWQRKDQEMHKHLDEAKAEREKPWQPPVGTEELVRRFESAGFRGGKVRP